MVNPTNIKEIKKEFVMHYCKEHQAEGAIDWLSAILNTPKKIDKNGKERDISFIVIRNEFAKKYFPHLVPIAQPRDKTMKDMLKEYLAQQQQ